MGLVASDAEWQLGDPEAASRRIESLAEPASS